MNLACVFLRGFCYFRRFEYYAVGTCYGLDECVGCRLGLGDEWMRPVVFFFFFGFLRVFHLL